MHQTHSIRTFQAEPGRYYLGDPCHAINPDRWAEFTLSRDQTVFASLDGHRCLIFRTTRDGVFMDNEVRQYQVDSGLLGLVPDVLVKRPDAQQNGTFLDWPQPFTCQEIQKDEHTGTLKFGTVLILID